MFMEVEDPVEMGKVDSVVALSTRDSMIRHSKANLNCSRIELLSDQGRPPQNQPRWLHSFAPSRYQRDH